MRLTIAPGGLGLQDRERYLGDSLAKTAVREKYRAHVADMLATAGETAPEASSHAQAILELETTLATAHWPAADAFDL
ncbi:hypothetical protein ABTN14_20145, partial [Acinetobacter baumannii]